MENREGTRYAALIVGGTKGIGLATALKLARPGALLFLNYHSDESAARAAAAGVFERGAIAHLIKHDIGRPEGAVEIIHQVSSVVNRLDAIVHSAAIANPGQISTQDQERIQEAIDVGGLSLLHLVRAALRLLGAGSSVVFLSGGAVDTVLPNHGALAASKALGECLTRYLAIECAPLGINCNILRVGPIDTDLFRSSRDRSASGESVPPPITPNGRRLSAEDVAEAASFLLSKNASMIRGQTIVVDGGLSKVIRGR